MTVYPLNWTNLESVENYKPGVRSLIKKSSCRGEGFETRIKKPSMVLIVWARLSEFPGTLIHRPVVSVYKKIGLCWRVVLVQLVSLLIICRMMIYLQMRAIIRGERGCAVASLWHRHVPSCGLAIGPRHPSYWPKTVLKVYNLFTLNQILYDL